MIDIPAGIRLVLASASPRRSELLRSVGLEFDVLPADIDESARPGELPADYVRRLSGEKAAVIAGRIGADAIVVAADTTVDVDGHILEKPVDDADARRMLTLLSGRTHLVHTGVRNCSTMSRFPTTPT
jgi:septum formation protein